MENNYDPMFNRNRTAEYIGRSVKTLDCYRNPKHKLFKNFPKPDSKIGFNPLWKQSTIEKWRDEYQLNNPSM